jgi:hypothetical protein
VLGISPEQLQDLFHAQFTRTALTTLDGLVGKLSLLLLQSEDSLLNRVFDGDLVDNNIYFLCKTVDSVDGLFLNKLRLLARYFLKAVASTYRIPERLKNNNSCGSC